MRRAASAPPPTRRRREAARLEHEFETIAAQVEVDTAASWSDRGPVGRDRTDPVFNSAEFLTKAAELLKERLPEPEFRRRSRSLYVEVAREMGYGPAAGS